jgi:hypothetical protein
VNQQAITKESLGAAPRLYKEDLTKLERELGCGIGRIMATKELGCVRFV